LARAGVTCREKGAFSRPGSPCSALVPAAKLQPQMNFKLLFPTYRTRFRFVLDSIGEITKGGRVNAMLNVGSGEGDIDPSLSAFAHELSSCDINEGDVAHARAANAHVGNITYSVENAEALRFGSDRFDLVTCLEVIEHVSDSQKVIHEIARVLKPGGSAIITCPSATFPATYDPINRVLAPLGKHVSMGAYGYGHSWLVKEEDVEGWFAHADLSIVKKERLTGALAGAVECYWPGLLQKMLKPNAGNVARDEKKRGIRASAGDPPLVAITDALIAADRALFSSSERAVGLAYVVTKS